MKPGQVRRAKKSKKGYGVLVSGVRYIKRGEPKGREGTNLLVASYNVSIVGEVPTASPPTPFQYETCPQTGTGAGARGITG